MTRRYATALASLLMVVALPASTLAQAPEPIESQEGSWTVYTNEDWCSLLVPEVADVQSCVRLLGEFSANYDTMVLPEALATTFRAGLDAAFDAEFEGDDLLDGDFFDEEDGIDNSNERPVKRRGKGEATTKAFELVGGDYRVAIKYSKKCDQDSSDFSLVDTDGSGYHDRLEQSGYMYSVEPGRYYWDVDANDTDYNDRVDCKWQVTIGPDR